MSPLATPNIWTSLALILLVGCSTPGCIFNTSGPDDPSNDADTADTADTADSPTDTAPARDASDGASLDVSDGASLDSSSPDLADSDTAEPIPLDDLADQWADVVCSGYFECCNKRERRVLTELGTDFDPDELSHCQNKYSGALEAGLVSDLQLASDNGRIAYDRSKMAECLAQQRSRECDAVPSSSSASSACEGAIEPKVQLHETCQRTFECTEGVCVKVNEESDTGTCTPLPSVGDNCLAGRCAEGAYCYEETCQPTKEAGDRCRKHLQCETYVCSDNACADKLAAGDACAADAQCKSDLCLPISDNSDPVCAGSGFCDGSD